MWDLRPHGLTGSKVEKILDIVHITTNKNSVVGDKNALNPGGIRLGTGALTTRGMKEPEMEKIAGYLMKSVEMSLRIQKVSGKKLVDFVEHLHKDEEVQALAAEIKAWARTFSIPGI
jgi:glycine hydroxymethyltransferase